MIYQAARVAPEKTVIRPVLPLRSMPGFTEKPMKPSQCKQCESSEGSVLCRRHLANGAIQIVYQCLTCGRSASNPLAKAKVPNFMSLPAWDDSLADEYDDAKQAERDSKRVEWFEEHDAYLRTPKWRAKRAAVLDRCGGLCEGCRQAKATQVHHLSYEHWQDELLWELVAVCPDCHERAHAERTTQ